MKRLPLSITKQKQLASFFFLYFKYREASLSRKLPEVACPIHYSQREYRVPESRDWQSGYRLVAIFLDVDGLETPSICQKA